MVHGERAVGCEHASVVAVGRFSTSIHGGQLNIYLPENPRAAVIAVGRLFGDRPPPTPTESKL